MFKNKYFRKLLLILLVLNGCDSTSQKSVNNKDNSYIEPKYNLYLCASISGSKGTSSGIYATQTNNLGNFKKIINLDSKEINLVDTCTVDNNGNIYWSDRKEKAIFKADKSLKNVTKIVSNIDIVLGLAIDEDNQKLYWSNWLQSNENQSGEIWYSNLDGTEQKKIISSLKSGGKISIDSINNKLYISDLFGHKILQSNLDGSNLKKFVDANQAEQIAIDIENSKLYWADIADDKIYTVNLDGTNKETVLSFDDPFANPVTLVLNDDNLLFNKYDRKTDNDILYSYNIYTKKLIIVNKNLPKFPHELILK